MDGLRAYFDDDDDDDNNSNDDDSRGLNSCAQNHDQQQPQENIISSFSLDQKKQEQQQNKRGIQHNYYPEKKPRLATQAASNHTTHVYDDDDDDHDDNNVHMTNERQTLEENEEEEGSSIGPAYYCDHPPSDKNSNPRPVRILTQEQAHQHAIFVRTEPHIRGNWAGLVYLVVQQEKDKKVDTDTGIAAAAAADPLVQDSCNVSGHDDDDTDDEHDLERIQIWKQWKQQSYRHVCRWITMMQHDDQFVAPVRQRKRSHKMNVSNDDKNDNNHNGTNSPILVVHKEPHISLTRTFYLQAAFLSSFLKGLQRIARNNQPPSPPSTRSTLRLTRNPLWRLVNDAGTRAFFAWPVVVVANKDQGQSTLSSSCRPTGIFLKQIVHDLNDLLQQYQQPAYYHPPQFHASFASSPLAAAAGGGSGGGSGDFGNPKVGVVIDKKNNTNNKGNEGHSAPKGTTNPTLLSWMPLNDDNVGEVQVELDVIVTRLYCRLGDQVYSFALGEDEDGRMD